MYKVITRGEHLSKVSEIKSDTFSIHEIKTICLFNIQNNKSGNKFTSVNAIFDPKKIANFDMFISRIFNMKCENFNDTRMVIRKKDDEWFLIVVTNLKSPMHTKCYECDGIEGVIEVLKLYS